jgi:hypothetical protein
MHLFRTSKYKGLAGKALAEPGASLCTRSRFAYAAPRFGGSMAGFFCGDVASCMRGAGCDGRRQRCKPAYTATIPIPTKPSASVEGSSGRIVRPFGGTGTALIAAGSRGAPSTKLPSESGISDLGIVDRPQSCASVRGGAGRSIADPRHLGHASWNCSF